MLSIQTGSLIKKARLTSDGKLLNQALELERACGDLGFELSPLSEKTTKGFNTQTDFKDMG